MKKIFLAIVFCFSFVMLNAQTKSDNIILKGIVTATELENYSWFKKNYDNYIPKENVIKALQSHKDATIKVFFGTWCDDSQNVVPTLLKVLDNMGYDKSKITLIALDKNKKSPEGFEKNMNVFKVPTIVVIKNEENSDRIVETPIETIEEDLLKIMTGKNYVHKYAE
ncbi:MAG: thioredoxin family protein [Limnohabitans sp.]|nr:thioredoxin family protein [Limnohabitans sp.]